MRENFSKITACESGAMPVPLSTKSTISSPSISRAEIVSSGDSASQYFCALEMRLMKTCDSRSMSVLSTTSSAPRRTSRSRPPAPVAATARSRIARRRTSARVRRTCAFSSTERSSRSSSRRVSRSASSWMMPEYLVRVATSRSPLSRSISENARMEVIGVRNSWLIWLRNASFWTDSRVSFSLAARSWRAVRASSADFASSWLECSMICAVSSATAIRSSTEILAPPVICPIIACAVAAPTDPARSRSSICRKSAVGSGR